MSYAPDPAGVFASDAHRRVMANVPNPDEPALDVDELRELRIAKDDHLDIEHEDLIDVLKDLEAAGHVKQIKDGWKNTPAGFTALIDKEN